MKHSYCSEHGKVKLEPLTSDHIEEMRLLRNKHKDCFVFSEEITAEAQKKWYNNYLDKDGDYVFSVFYKNMWVGSVSIYNVSENSAEFGRLLIDSEKAQIKGLGIDTTLCACKIAFKSMMLSKLTLQVYEDNIAAYKTYLKAGFVQYGTSYDAGNKKLIDMEIYK